MLGIRLSYLDHPIQGDDYYYLASAMYGQTDPVHPNHARYIFQGKEVDMRGHPHPPLNSWILTATLAAAKDIRETTFHGVYVLFTLMALAGVWILARRFSPHPEWAVALTAVIPVFLVNGNSLEADLPFFACWTLGIATFISGRLWLAIPLLACAGLAAYQSVAAVPILWLYLWLFRRDWKPGWIASLAPVPRKTLVGCARSLSGRPNSQRDNRKNSRCKNTGQRSGKNAGLSRFPVLMLMRRPADNGV